MKTAEELIRNLILEKEWGNQKFRIENNCLIIIDACGFGTEYDIPLEDVKSAHDVCAWAIHLGAKEWADKKIIIAVCKLMMEHLGLSISTRSGGRPLPSP